MARSTDFIIGRGGDSLRGRVLDKQFEIRSAFGPVVIKTDKIEWIHFDRPRGTDEMWLKNGDRLQGRLKQDSIHFKPQDAAARRIPRSAIHTVIIGAGFTAGALSL
jgi:hypothetical protein